MIRLADPGLDQEAVEALACYQREVDAAGSYADRVVRAKESFARRNRLSNCAFGSVREALTVMCSGAQRCAYCEDSVGYEVEHIEPKDLYPCKVFVWANYVYACGHCNKLKGRRFSVMDGDRLADVTRRPGAPIVPPLDGLPAFVNPRVDDPLEYLHLDLETFWLVARDEGGHIDWERAEFTIEVLRLNRDVLVAARKTAYFAYRTALFEYSERKPGAVAEELAALVDHIKTMPHPTVWTEMKRQHSSIPLLRDAFSQTPEAFMW